MTIWRRVIIHGEVWPYEISAVGAIRYVGKVHSRCLSLDKNGYVRCNLSNGDKREKIYIHRLVATAFLGIPLPGKEVNHKDGDKTNNHTDNLAS